MATLPDDVDPECRELCEAMSALRGVSTVESCCGHGERPYYVWFVVADLSALPPLLYHFDPCHGAPPGWAATAKTDCAMCPAFFLLAGPTGEDGYAGARTIAGLLRKYAAERAVAAGRAPDSDSERTPPCP